MASKAGSSEGASAIDFTSGKLEILWVFGIIEKSHQLPNVA